MGVSHQQLFDEVFFLHLGCRLATATPTLGFIIRERLVLHIAFMGEGHHHIFWGDQIFHVDFDAGRLDHAATHVAELALHQLQLFTDHFHQTGRAVQNAQQFGDLIEQFLVLVEDLLMLEAGQLVQTQIEDGLSLLFGQEVLTVTDTVLRLQPFRTSGIITGTLQHGGHRAQLPRLSDQPGLGIRRAR